MILHLILLPLVSATVFHSYLQRHYGEFAPVIEESLAEAFVYCGGAGDDWATEFRELFADRTRSLAGSDLTAGRHETIHDMVSAALVLTRSARVDPITRERIALDILQTDGKWDG